MKRQLSLVLALVMILGSFSAVFAAEMPVTAVDKAAFLEKEGILKGKLDGSLDLVEDLRRRDAVVVLSRLFGVEEEAEAYPAEELKFTDIEADYYKGFIAWAFEEGYVVGKTETTFDDKGDLTAQQFATMLLRALGYEDNGTDIFKEAYNEAKKLEIFAGLELEEKDTISRGDMAAMTYNALGVKVKGGDKTLAETLGITMLEAPAAKELKIEKVYTENLAEMEIELSNAKLADRAKLENENNYTIVGPNSEKVKVYKAEVIENNVRLTLIPYGRTDKTQTVKPLLKDRNYSLTIRNIDKVINEKTIRNILAVDNAIPTVESVEFMGTYGIKVVTSEPIKDAQERFFTVDNTRTSMFVEQFGRTLILTPYLSASFDKDAKELTIGKLEDYAGFTATEQKFDLNLAEEDVKPVVKNVYRSGNVLTVEFEEDIFHKSISGYETRRDLGNVTFKDGRVNFYAKADPVKVNETTVVYTFEREIPRNVEVEISGIQNHFGTEMDVVSMMPELLRDEAIPYIIDPVEKMNTLVYKAGSYNATNKTADVEMEITFDKEDMTGFVDANGNIKAQDLSEHFELYEIEIASRNRVSELITSARVDKDTVFVTFTGIKVQNLNNDNDYVLEVKRFSDKAGNRMETSYIDFEVKDAAAAFNVTSVSVKPSTEYSYASEIVMTFNRPLDKAEAEKVNNYYLGKNGTVRAVRAYLEKDGKTVSLLMRDRSVADVEALETLEISSNVKESSKRFTVANRFWNLKTGKAANIIVPVTEGITYINDSASKATYKVENNVLNTVKEALDLDVVVEATENFAAGEFVVKATNKAGEQLFFNSDAETLTVGKATKNITIADAKIAADDVITVETIIKGEAQNTLTINILDPTDTAKVSVAGTTLATLTDGGNINLPYGVKIANLDESDINVVADGKATVVNKEIVVNKVVVTIKPQIGANKVYTMTLVEPALFLGGITFEATPTIDEDANTVKLTVMASIDNGATHTIPVSGLTKNDVELILSDSTATAKTKTLVISQMQEDIVSNGTYTIVLSEDIKTTANAETMTSTLTLTPTVKGVEGTAKTGIVLN